LKLTLQTSRLTDRSDLGRTEPIGPRNVCKRDPRRSAIPTLLLDIIPDPALIMHSQSSKSTSGPRFILPVTVWKINLRSRLEGQGNSIFLSNRPGRKRAGSRVSCRLVAMMTWGTMQSNHKSLRSQLRVRLSFVFLLVRRLASTLQLLTLTLLP
jgi:hypothetical protein